MEFNLRCNSGAGAFASDRFVPKFVKALWWFFVCVGVLLLLCSGFVLVGCFFYLVTHDAALCNSSAVESKPPLKIAKPFQQALQSLIFSLAFLT